MRELANIGAEIPIQLFGQGFKDMAHAAAKLDAYWSQMRNRASDVIGFSLVKVGRLILRIDERCLLTLMLLKLAARTCFMP